MTMQDEKPPMKKLPTSMLPEETAPRPEFPEQEQTPPGLDAEMEPSPDHGETSYSGSGRLAGKKALITGGDSVLAVRWRSPLPAKAPTSR